MRHLLALALLLLAGCSDPLDDEPRGQTIPTEPERVTTFAPGSGGGGGGMAAGSAGASASGGQAGGQAGGMGGASTPAGAGRTATVQPSAPQAQGATPGSGQAGQGAAAGAPQN